MPAIILSIQSYNLGQGQAAPAPGSQPTATLHSVPGSVPSRPGDLRGHTLGSGRFASRSPKAPLTVPGEIQSAGSHPDNRSHLTSLPFWASVSSQKKREAKTHNFLAF